MVHNTAKIGGPDPHAAVAKVGVSHAILLMVPPDVLKPLAHP